MASNDYQRPAITDGEARSLLREAVSLNIQHVKTGREQSRFSDERDAVTADLALYGRPTNYADYSHPSEV